VATQSHVRDLVTLQKSIFSMSRSMALFIWIMQRKLVTGEQRQTQSHLLVWHIVWNVCSTLKIVEVESKEEVEITLSFCLSFLLCARHCALWYFHSIQLFYTRSRLSFIHKTTHALLLSAFLGRRFIHYWAEATGKEKLNVQSSVDHFVIVHTTLFSSLRRCQYLKLWTDMEHTVIIF